MAEKHPYVTKVEISRADRRRGNKAKSVKMAVYTSYNSDNEHTITYTCDGDGVRIQRHTKDYGKRLPADMDERVSDVEVARETARDELESLGLNTESEWDDESI